MKKKLFSIALITGLFASIVTLNSSCEPPTKSQSEIDRELQELLQAKEDAMQDIHSDSLSLDMQIPASLVETTELDSLAPLQYMNATEEFYIRGDKEGAEIATISLKMLSMWDDNKKLDENYLDFTYVTMEDNGTAFSERFKTKDIKCKNAKGKLRSQVGRYPGINADIVYWIATFEKNNNVHCFVLWTFASKKSEVETKVLKTLSSIKFD